MSDELKKTGSSAVPPRDEEVLTCSTTDPEEFSKIIDRYEAHFLRRAEHIVRNKDDAADIVQDTFVKIYVNASRFRPMPGATFRSWAYKILHNTCMSHLRKTVRDRSATTRIDEDLEMVLRDESEIAIDERGMSEYVLLLLSKIPEAASRLLKLRIFDGKSHEEIASLEGVSEGAVRTRLHRAREKIKAAHLALEETSL